MISKVARDPDWIKLSYENQKLNQSLITFQPTEACLKRFALSQDTLVAEGARLTLTGTADCTARYFWESLSGLGPRILDPEVKSLEIIVPRISRDAVLKYRFTAVFGNSLVSGDVEVRIQEAIPEPRFTMPERLQWNGKDSLLLKPDIGNLAAIQASRNSVLVYSWSVEGLTFDTAWGDGTLLLKPTLATGTVTVELCLSNQGPLVCRTTLIAIGQSTHVTGPRRSESRKGIRLYDPLGRRLGMLWTDGIGAFAYHDYFPKAEKRSHLSCGIRGQGIPTILRSIQEAACP